MNIKSPEVKRENLSHTLLREESAPRYAVGAEQARVSDLMNEAWIDPHAHEGQLVVLGRNVLERIGIHTRKKPYALERPYLQESQARKTESISRELEATRNALRENIIQGVDDVAIDEYLGLRTPEASILPSFIASLHEEAEKEKGQTLSFTEWMSEIATNEQLLNVLQWHDTYLEELDNDPEFLERVAQIKSDYMAGTTKAIEEGKLHPSVARDPADLDAFTVRHASPLSPVMAEASVGKGVVQVRPDFSDFTLYHEFTHPLGGFNFMTDEGATDEIAKIIFESNPHFNASDTSPIHVYQEQSETLSILERLSDGELTLYRISKLYANSSDRNENMAELIDTVDTKLGAPLCLAATKLSDDFIDSHIDQADSSVVRRAAQLMNLRNFQRMEKLIMHVRQQGGEQQPDLGSYIRSLVADSKKAESSFSQEEFNDLVSIIRTAHQLETQLAVAAANNRSVV